MASSRSKADERAARVQALEAQRRRERQQNLVRGGITGLVLVILVVGIFFAVNKGRDKVDTAAATADSDYRLVIGPDDAPHKIIIYEDFLCPICQMLEETSHTGLEQAAAAGKVQLDYRPFHLLGDGGDDDYSARSAAAFSVVLAKSGAAVADRFHDLLYDPANQPSESGPFPDDDWLVTLAVQAGADEDAVKDAIENGDGNAWVEGATSFAEGVKIPGTPTVFLDGQVYQDGGTASEVGTNLVSAVG